jgi:hypothetical protein
MSPTLTVAEWVKQKRMGEEAMQYARAYALWAERRMGELLTEMEKANEAKGNPYPQGRG